MTLHELDELALGTLEAHPPAGHPPVLAALLDFLIQDFRFGDLNRRTADASTTASPGPGVPYLSGADIPEAKTQRGAYSTHAHSLHHRRGQAGDAKIRPRSASPVLFCLYNPMRQEVLCPAPPSCQIHPRLQHLRRHDSGRPAFFLLGAAQWWGRLGPFATTTRCCLLAFGCQRQGALLRPSPTPSQSNLEYQPQPNLDSWRLCLVPFLSLPTQNLQLYLLGALGRKGGALTELVLTLLLQ